MKKPLGVILYDGSSVLDGEPIVVIATFNSKNVKTGNMIQTWILKSDVAPMEASSNGSDYSICGACPHRHYLNGSCYVDQSRAPTMVYKAYKNNAYPTYDALLHAKYVKNRKLRLGAYGDPAAVPFSVWDDLISNTELDGHTGYTHQIRHTKFDIRILRYCMASADTPKQALAHQKLGARTFRVKTVDAPMLPNEIECLSDSKNLECLDCLLCSGNKAPKNIVINVHGSKASRYTQKFSKANLIAVSN